MRIAQAYGGAPISTGEILRAQIEQGTSLGEQAKAFMAKGVLVPDELVLAIVRRRLAEADCTDGYILDGFPRSVPQAHALCAMMAENGETLDAAINVTVPDAELVERLTARRSCPKCGTIYNLKFRPSRRNGFCDNEGAENVVLVQRPDDEEATVLERLRVYHRTTEPLLEYYQAEGLLKSVDGAGMFPDGVFVKVEEILAALGAVRSE